VKGLKNVVVKLRDLEVPSAAGTPLFTEKLLTPSSGRLQFPRI
jgi:hypothetical protein